MMKRPSDKSKRSLQETATVQPVRDQNRRKKKRNKPSLRSPTSFPGLFCGTFLLVTLILLIGQAVKNDHKWLQPRNLRHTQSIPTQYQIDGVISFLNDFIKELHERLSKHGEGRSTYHDIWKEYHDLVVERLLPWDQEYLKYMPDRRLDGSIFLSVASYRDENCLNTLHEAYHQAKFPEMLNVGLVQQNCYHDCVSGVQKDGSTAAAAPDPDCHRLFCETALGRPHCEAGRVRALHVEESESLGPYAARYLASKLWDGESWFLQIDSHMTFATEWDAQSIEMLSNAPSSKPILSTYPRGAEENLDQMSGFSAGRICDSYFAPEEGSTIRLEASDGGDEEIMLGVPRFAPFVAAGYFVAHSGILKEVPFDPFLPWIFMGEEIIMSSRFYTHGYTIFAPTHDVVGHIYGRRGKPKFWETLDRKFWDGIQNPLQQLILRRIKHQLGYLEDSRDFIKPKSLLTAVDLYGMGTTRSIKDYTDLAGFDPATKEHRQQQIQWCKDGKAPPAFDEVAGLYEEG